MAIQQGQTTSFKLNLYQQYFLNSGYVFKIALYTSGVPTLDGTTTAYSATNEATGTGYTAGGQVLTGAVVGFDATSGTAFVTFNNAVWAGAITARAALIYNSSLSNQSVAVIDFGQNVTSTNTFTVVMPSNTYTTALIRSV